MNFFLDHDVPEDLGRLLRRKGHSVHILKEVLDQEMDTYRRMRRHQIYPASG